VTKAIWNGVVVAESDQTVVVEGNHYFPPESIRRDYFRPSARRSTCYWKGQASYYDLVVDGREAAGVAWYYPNPNPAAAHIRDHVAFYGLVTIEK
jgi:uncharacterized protein (DUF427 family)